MAREKADRGETISSRSSKMKRTDEDDDEDNFKSRHGDLGGNEPPEPEVLLAILNRKSKR